MLFQKKKKSLSQRDSGLRLDLIKRILDVVRKLRDPFVDEEIRVDIVVLCDVGLHGVGDAFKIGAGQHADTGAHGPEGDGNDDDDEDDPPCFLHTVTSL